MPLPIEMKKCKRREQSAKPGTPRPPSLKKIRVTTNESVVDSFASFFDAKIKLTRA